MKEAEYTVEFNKVFINLASLLLGTSLLFVAQVSAKDHTSVGLLLASWILWTLSIYLGAQSIGEISTIAGEAEIEEKSDNSKHACDIVAERLNNTAVSRLIKGQMWLFLLGFIALIANASIRALN